jgi:broad specificity phosphatase PhoE
VIEVRRHSYTKKGETRGRGSHLSADGVHLARHIGESIGPFDHVVASDVPRTLETAIAMGFAVDEIVPFPEALAWDAVIEEMGWHALWDEDRPFAYLKDVLPARPQTARLAAHYAEQWRRIANEYESALVLTHGLIIEAGLVACFPDADHKTWGRPFSHCEGARLQLRDGAFSRIEILRV